MENAGKAPLPRLVDQDFGHVLVRVAGMDDERQPGFARGPDVGAEVGALILARAAVVVVIEPGLADADHQGIAGKLDQALGRRDAFGLDLMRMDADGAPDTLMGGGDGAHVLELREMGADAHHRPDAGLGGAPDHGVAVVVEDVEIEMAMAVDQHCPGQASAAASSSTKRGNTGCGLGTSAPVASAWPSPRCSNVRASAGTDN